MSDDTQPPRAHLVVYLPDLAGGGAERLHVGLAPLFLAAGLRVTFLVHRRRGALLDSVPSGVRIVSLEARRPLAALPRLIGFLRRERPQLLLANTEHMNIVAIWAKLVSGSPTRLIVAQHNALSRQAMRPGLQFKALPFLYRRFLSRADAIVAVSHGVANELEAMAGLAAGSVRVVYNGVVDDGFAARAGEPVAHPWLDGRRNVLIAVGRMVVQKDHATLIRAFARASQSRDLRLIILGDGPLRAELSSLAASLGVAERIDMPGFVENPLPFIARSASLVLSSQFEGFGNVLAEALACGTQVVSADCPFGPAEILADGRFGRLTPVGDSEAMAGAMLAALDDPIDATALRARGAAFSTEACASAYLSLFEDLVRSPALARAPGHA
jgi:glycosyltransferase involved in cell wall biosynthesis